MNSEPHALHPGKHEILVDDFVWLGHNYSVQGFRIYGSVVRSDCADLVGKKTVCMVYAQYPADSSLSFTNGSTISVETVTKPMRKGGELQVTWLGKRS